VTVMALDTESALPSCTRGSPYLGAFGMAGHTISSLARHSRTTRSIRNARSPRVLARARLPPTPRPPTRGYRRFVKIASVLDKDHATWVRSRPPGPPVGVERAVMDDATGLPRAELTEGLRTPSVERIPGRSRGGGAESVRTPSVGPTQGVSRAGLPGPWGVRHGRSHKGFSRARDSHPPPAQPTRGYRRFVKFASVSGKDHATWVRTRPSSSLCATPTRPIGLHPTPPGRHHGRRPSAGGFIPRRMKHPASVPPQTEVCRWLCPKKWCNKVGAIPVCCV